VKKLLVFALIAAAGWFYFHEAPASWRGMPAAKDPEQTVAGLPPAFDHGDYRITPLACYRVTAVVLSRERYRNDPAAPLAPVDLALGWGPMSVAGVINDLKISQSARWYEYTYPGDPPLDPGLIASHSANTHCLPATPEVRRLLLDVKRHDLVSMEGCLVEVAGPDGYHWRSSLSRDDTGGGACEVFWITALSVLPAPQ
jgi:hypothetical protein